MRGLGSMAATGIGFVGDWGSRKALAGAATDAWFLHVLVDAAPRRGMDLGTAGSVERGMDLVVAGSVGGIALAEMMRPLHPVRK